MFAAIFRLLLSILLMPFHLVASIFSRRQIPLKDASICLRIQYTEDATYITRNSSSEEPNELIVAYLLFLSQFFYSCDSRQVDAVSDALSQLMDEGSDAPVLVPRILSAIQETFSSKELDAYLSTFSDPNEPSQYFLDGPSPDKALADYSIFTFIKASSWLIDLRVSYRLLLIFFPVTVGVLYYYTILNIPDTELPRFESCLREYLSEFKSTDFRSSFEGAHSTFANRVIRKHLSFEDELSQPMANNRIRNLQS